MTIQFDQVQLFINDSKGLNVKMKSKNDNNGSNNSIKIKNYNSINDILNNPTYTVTYIANPIQQTSNAGGEYYINKSLIMTRVSKIFNDFSFQHDNSINDDYSNDIDRIDIIDNNNNDIESQSNDNSSIDNTNDSISNDINNNNNNNNNNNINNSYISNNKSSSSNNNSNNNLIQDFRSISNTTILGMVLALTTISIVIFIYVCNYYSISWTVILVSSLVFLLLLMIVITFTVRYQLMTTSNYISIVDTNNEMKESR